MPTSKNTRFTRKRLNKLRIILIISQINKNMHQVPTNTTLNQAIILNSKFPYLIIPQITFAPQKLTIQLLPKIL